ncbi:MAG: TraR/DksA family transcriptional regulator [Acidimicrobiia bacterium]|nr:TraR/DksA family transcriptional regulator [Acidimicrobiia bacterium]MDH5294467.1 TraR/DksA family transcriptional regulator [Acidimicrobiia bacterium]
MAKALAKTKLNELKAQLEAERERLADLIAEHEQELEEARLSETSADRSPDPGSAEAGSMKFEYEKELSLERNSIDLLHKVERALGRLEDGTYGTCESCGSAIPVARLEVLPYATMCVTCASKRG